MKGKRCRYNAPRSIFFIKFIASFFFSFSKRSAIYQCKFLLCKKLTCKNQTWFPLIDQDHATLNELKQRYNLILIVIMHYARTHCPKMKMNEEKMSQSWFHFPGLLVLYSLIKHTYIFPLNSLTCNFLWVWWRTFY